MVTTQVRAVVGSAMALRRMQAVYPVVSITDVLYLFIVNRLSGASGSCAYRNVVDYLSDISRASSGWSFVRGHLEDMTGRGLLCRHRKGARFRYSVTVQGVNLLNDMEKALRALRL